MTTRPRTPLVRLVAGPTVAALLLAGCGAEEPRTDDGDGARPSGTDREPVTLTLVTHDSFDVSEEVLAGFTDRTGIEVEIAPAGDAGSTVNQAILTRDDPLGDVLFGVDTTFLSRALEEDLFVPYQSPELVHVPPEYVADGEHRVTPVDVGDVCLNYDRDWFEEAGLEVPSDLADLTDERYAGLLTVLNPATSSPGLAFLLATVERFGEDGYLDYWAQLRDQDVLVTDGWTDAYYGEFSAHEGDRPLVVSYASSPPAEVFYAEGELDTPPTGVIEASCFRQVEFAGILRGTEHEEEARQLIDLLLSREFQEDLPLTMFVHPVREDAELPEVFEAHAVLPDDPLELDPQVIGDQRETWIDAWTRTVLR